MYTYAMQLRDKFTIVSNKSVGYMGMALCNNSNACSLGTLCVCLGGGDT